MATAMPMRFGHRHLTGFVYKEIVQLASQPRVAQRPSRSSKQPELLQVWNRVSHALNIDRFGAQLKKPLLGRTAYLETFQSPLP